MKKTKLKYENLTTWITLTQFANPKSTGNEPSLVVQAAKRVISYGQ